MSQPCHITNVCRLLRIAHFNRLATDRSIRNSSNGENPGKILPASHPGSPAKRKSDTEDALAIVNRKCRPHLFITVTMNANWPEITSNVLPGQTAYDRPDLCCRVFKIKLEEIMAELNSGKVFGPYLAHLGVIECWIKSVMRRIMCSQQPSLRARASLQHTV